MQPRTPKWLEDIRDSAQFILDDTAGETFESYLQNRRLRQSVERGFLVIGEAMRRLSHYDPAIADRMSARRQIIALRNVLIHEYDVIDQARLWQIIQRSLPVLKTMVEELLRETGQ